MTNLPQTPALRTIPLSNPRSVLSLLAGSMLFGVLSLALPVTAAEVQPDPAAVVLEQLRAANAARSELAREEAAWRNERERLLAAIAATQAEVARLEHAAAQAEEQRDGARTKLAAIGEASELDPLRARLGEAGHQLRASLAALATSVPPGTIAVPADDLTDEAAFDAAVRALDAAERAAATVSVEVVTGTRGGQTEAVKLLRVAGAAAWWVALDGTAAGTAQMVSGTLHLHPTSDEPGRLAILAALAQAEGRAHPTLVVLPAPAGHGAP